MKVKNQNFRRTVLVVDDEEVNRSILGTILETEYEVLYAENGQEALDQVHAHKETLSLILLDLLMPQMDGYEVLNVLRTDTQFRKIPVVVLTSEKSAEVKSLKLGAADFLSKPYDLPEVILARVSHAIELFEGENIIQATETDGLTGLLTNEFFFEYSHQFDQYHPERAMDAVVLNLSRFHLLNELYGRAGGDSILSTIAAQLRAISDSEDGLAARVNSDTFYLYLPHRASYDSVLGQLTTALKELLSEQEIQVRLGVYSDIYRELPLEHRFDRALQACNSLRTKYGSSVAFYDQAMHEKEVFQARLLADFDNAIAQKQFLVLYQPKYNIKGEKPHLCSAEALVCWQHPEFGRLTPKAFIPLFEQNGQIQKLDHYVWREAASQIKKWKETSGIELPVSVNVSRVDVYDPQLEDFLLSLVKENEIKTSSLLLEITESAYTENSKQIVEVVNSLRKSGFKIEMDDFGSGYSSLNMLTTLPIDALKLDMVFIRNICVDSKEMRMVELVLEIAEFLKVPVIAEGVEEKAQYELLKKAGCDIIQGFYFSRQILAEEFSRLISKKM